MRYDFSAEVSLLDVVFIAGILCGRKEIDCSWIERVSPYSDLRIAIGSNHNHWLQYDSYGSLSLRSRGTLCDDPGNVSQEDGAIWTRHNEICDLIKDILCTGSRSRVGSANTAVKAMRVATSDFMLIASQMEEGKAQ